MLLCALPGATQRIAPKKHVAAKPPAQAQERYSTTLLHNADVTVRRLNIPPGAEAPISASTHDYLIISIGSNSITVKNDKTSFDMDLRPGEMQVVDGGWQHVLMNRGATEAELFIIEPAHNINPKNPICGLGATTCSEHHFGETAQGTYNQYVQFETESTKLLRLTLAPGVATHLHEDKNKHLIVALTPFRGHQDQQSFDMKAGDMRWIPSGFQELGNDGTSEARVLILELR
jgi:mannose-6-phosphate isomerase-like protein (cupin superfamily)